MVSRKGCYVTVLFILVCVLLIQTKVRISLCRTMFGLMNGELDVLIASFPSVEFHNADDSITASRFHLKTTFLVWFPIGSWCGL